MTEVTGKQIGVLIGGMRLPHKGHIDIIKEALTLSDVLFILIGSVNLRTSPKVPFTYEERAHMLRLAIPDELQNRVHIGPVNDYKYIDTRWEQDVQATVKDMTEKFVTSKGLKAGDVTLFGFNKDQTSYYLRSFPQWKQFNSTPIYNKKGEILSSTDFRKAWLSHGQSANSVDFRGREGVLSEVITYLTSRPYNEVVQREYEYYVHELDRYKSYPYPEELNFVCCDAVVECAGHILTIFREEEQCAALPGGFKKGLETFFDGMVRELNEETSLNVEPHVLQACVVNDKIYDSLDRNEGYPRITRAYHMKLPAAWGLPRVKGANEVKTALWTPFDEFMEETAAYDDHKFIVSEFTKVYQSIATTHHAYL